MMMLCRICRNQTNFAFSALVLSKYEASYNSCANCGYLFATDPHWLSEAYKTSRPSSDTGNVRRNISISAKLACFLYGAMNERVKDRYVDLAGGYGMLTRMMRDYGFDYFWHDPYEKNLLAQGFEFDIKDGLCTAATAFEVLEHVIDPIAFMEECLASTGADMLIFTTVLYGDSIPNPNTWWYYAFLDGQHIGFFQKRTLEVLAKKLGFYFTTANQLHIFSKKKIPRLLVMLTTNKIFSQIFSHFVRIKLGSKAISDRSRLLG